MMTVIDAEGHILGRISSEVAQRIMNGEEITIVNASKAIVTGKREAVFRKYKQRKDRGKIRKGPYYPRRADLILKRTVKGMVPYGKSRGKEALSRLKVFVGVPDEYSDTEKEKVEDAMELNTARYVTLGDISAHLGSKVR